MNYNFISAFDNFDKFTNRIGFVLKAPTAFPFSVPLTSPQRKGEFLFPEHKVIGKRS